MTKSILLLFSIISIWSCISPKLDPLDFVETEVIKPEFENFNAARLKGKILRQGTSSLGECGFLWAYDLATVENITADTQRIVVDLPSIGSGGEFEVSLGNLERERSIYVRTFVSIYDENAGTRTVFSAQTKTFTVGEIVANTGKALISNNSVVVYGQLLGLVAEEKSVDQHGHVISKNNHQPAIGCADCVTSTKGLSNDDKIFYSEFDSLEFNTTYYVRAYAIAYGQTFYSKTVDTFRVRDGWERVGDFHSQYAEGTASILDNIVYAGFGCKNALGCLDNDLDSFLWKFNPQAQNGMGEWSSSVPIPSPSNISKQRNDVSFAIGGKFHAMCGVIGDLFQNLQNNLISFDPNTQSWGQSANTIPGLGRTGAVAFTLNGKAYVGSGRDNNNKEYDDFWEYDPMTNLWRQVASLPLQFSPFTLKETMKGRHEAVAFTINGYAYVGSGRYGLLDLRDFWRFRPPVGMNDLGEWDNVSFLPPEAAGRYQAVAMSIKDKGYVGTGYNATVGYLNDWWQYDPVKNEWFARTSFPAEARTNAMGFAINEQGYLGTGHTKILINGGLSAKEFTLQDFWRYVPEE